MSDPKLGQTLDPGRESSEKLLPKPEKGQSTALPTAESDTRRNPAKQGVLLPAQSEKKSALNRAMGFVRTVAPYARKVLPLLEGNVISAVSNILAPVPAAPRVDLEPIENAIAKMRKDHVDLRINVADQTVALKRLTDKLETVREATERSNQEQKVLTQELKSLRAKVTLAAWLGVGLLVVSILVNVLLLIRIQHRLP
jgi:hypothetical protein